MCLSSGVCHIGRNSALLYLCALLVQFSGLVQADSILDDSFSASELNTCRWVDDSEPGGAVSLDNALKLTTNNESPGSAVVVSGQNGINGDFVMTIQITPDEGWEEALSEGFFSAGISVGGDPNNRINLNIQKFSPNDVSVQALQDLSLGKGSQLNRIDLGAFSSGHLRISRVGSQWKLEFDVGGGWRTLSEFVGDTGLVYPSLNAIAINTGNNFTMAFDEFRLEGGELRASNRPTKLDGFLPRSDLMVGGVFESHVVWRKWGGLWTELNPVQVLADNGMNWARVGITNFSAPELVGKSESEWPNLYRDDDLYWGAQEVRFQMLKDAKAAGMRLLAFFYLSGRYGEWTGHFGQQFSPAEWQDLEMDDLLLAIEQRSAEMTQKMIDEGLNIEIYEIGNETDSGLVGFQEDDRVNFPPGANSTSDIALTEQYLWAPQAEILKAAIKGIHSVNPNAKIALHPAGLSDRPAQYFTKAFFKYMKDEGVEYDYAAISWPYPLKDGPLGGEWRINRWSVPCWFYSMEELSAYLAALGKPMYIAEGSFIAGESGNLSPPIEGYPFSEQGQADMMSTMLNFVSNNLNMLGFFYFYPDFYPRDAFVDLKHIGLFKSGSETMAAVDSLNVNLPEALVIDSDFDGHWVDPTANGYLWLLKITEAPTSDTTGVAQLYWCTEPVNDPEATQCSGIVATGIVSGNRISFPSFVHVDAPLFADGFESEKNSTRTWLQAEVAFLNESSGSLTFNGDHEWDSGRYSIQRP